MSNKIKIEKKILYQVETLRDETVIKAFISFANRVNHPNVTRNFLIVGLASLACVLPSIFLWLRLVFLVFGLFCILMGLFRERIPLSAAKKRDPDYLEKAVLTYSFYAYEIVILRNGMRMEGERKYKDIVNFYDDEFCYYVNFENGDLIILPKDRFTVGDSTEFGAFITSKSGKKCVWTPATSRNKRILADVKKRERMERARAEQEKMMAERNRRRASRK